MNTLFREAFEPSNTVGIEEKEESSKTGCASGGVVLDYISAVGIRLTRKSHVFG